jgi:pimeloyl-ACP methyl ester carboxylesterase
MSAHTRAAESGGKGVSDTRHDRGDNGPKVLFAHGGVQTFAWQKPLSAAGWVSSPAAMRRAAEIADRAQIPVLVITGGYSPAQNKRGEIVAKLIHGRHVIVPSPNHFVQQMNPEEFSRVVNDFMSTSDHRRTTP